MLTFPLLPNASSGSTVVVVAENVFVIIYDEIARKCIFDTGDNRQVMVGPVALDSITQTLNLKHWIVFRHQEPVTYCVNVQKLCMITAYKDATELVLWTGAKLRINPDEQPTSLPLATWRMLPSNDRIVYINRATLEYAKVLRSEALVLLLWPRFDMTFRFQQKEAVDQAVAQLFGGDQTVEVPFLSGVPAPAAARICVKCDTKAPTLQCSTCQAPFCSSACGQAHLQSEHVNMY